MMKKQVKKTSKKKQSILNKPNLIVRICGLKCDIKVNPDVYSLDDQKKISKIINFMAQDIWIDKTYVNYKGTRWKNAFIVEDKWYELMRLVIKTNFGQKANRAQKSEILASFLVIAMMYLYDILEKYNYSVEDVDITFKTNKYVKMLYKEDPRTSWNF